jgi:hypothetical protein
MWAQNPSFLVAPKMMSAISSSVMARLYVKGSERATERSWARLLICADGIVDAIRFRMCERTLAILHTCVARQRGRTRKRLYSPCRLNSSPVHHFMTSNSACPSDTWASDISWYTVRDTFIRQNLSIRRVLIRLICVSLLYVAMEDSYSITRANSGKFLAQTNGR